MATTKPFPLVFGGSAFGSADAVPIPNFHTVEDCQEVVDVFTSYGHAAFDTSNFYAGGTSEQLISKLDLKGAKLDTKIFPAKAGDHGPGRLRELVEKAVKTLSPHKINILYLHAPDRTVPYEDTLREINELHKEGCFEKFGLSNFQSWEVAEFVVTGRVRGWITPSVYQGKYNALERTVEQELLPCLKKYGMSFYGYSPLAGGLLSGRLLSFEDMDTKGQGSRWDLERAEAAGPVFGGFIKRMREQNGVLFPILRQLKDTLEASGITLPEAALRWLRHHSALDGDKDRVIIGASKLEQVHSTLQFWDKGPLSEDIVQLFEHAWDSVRTKVGHYATI